jgi:bacillithiol system protein YtxJ
MGLFSRSTVSEQFPWIDLTSENQLNDSLNSTDVIFIFKHSTRCSISTMAKSKFEREWGTPDFLFQLLYLDLLNYRSISNKIEELTGVEHQSPQLIVINSGKVIYQKSHNAISAKESIEAATL